MWHLRTDFALPFSDTLQRFGRRVSRAGYEPARQTGAAPRFALARPAEQARTPIRIRRKPRAATPSLADRAFRTVQDIYALARHPEPGEGPDERRDPPHAQELADERRGSVLAHAQGLAEAWRERAEAAEARAAALENRLAASENAALDLRSRLVCLQGKLAATSATARYHSMTMALEQGGGTDHPAPDLRDDPGSLGTDASPA